jgi:predicted alpha/beta superfamily hydrolase
MLLMVLWRNYKEGRVHSVVGNLLIANNIYSPQLNNSRDILVWLPFSYDGQKRYPVIYMHDGYNLFDAHTSFAGEWQVDETLAQLAEEGLEAIVVGIPNNEQRLLEYSPFADRRFKMEESKGDSYIRFIVETLKPIIDADFKTYTDVAHTGMIGSSMGGLISMYAHLRYGHVFGFVGAMSPSFWFANGSIIDMVNQTPFPTGRLYLDIGAKETRYGAKYMAGVKNLADTLYSKGYSKQTLMYFEDEQGQHNETSWAKRLPRALRFLLKPVREKAL